jgi:hypothetical protein
LQFNARTMFMISMVIIPLGGISSPPAGRLDAGHEVPTSRVNYTGRSSRDGGTGYASDRAVVSAVAGLDRRLDVVGGQRTSASISPGPDLSEAADEVRTRLDRVRTALPSADPPTVFVRLGAMPIMGIGVQGLDR